MSRLDTSETITEDEQCQMMAYCMSHSTLDESVEAPNDLEEMAEAFLGEEEVTQEDFPMSPALIRQEQRKDKSLIEGLKKSPHKYSIKTVEGHDLISTEDKIVVPSSLQGRIVAWYHLYLRHPGYDRMEKTVSIAFTWKNMRDHIRRYVQTCRECQLCKKNVKKYGHLPPKEAEPAVPWNRVNVDLIGPYNVKVGPKDKDEKKENLQLRAMTMIDPATGWFEIHAIPQATAECCMEAFDDQWLCRYPRPQYLGCDGGSEFKDVFQQMARNYGLVLKPSTPYNPQGNSIVERIHQVVGDQLRTFELDEQELNTHNPWSPFLSAVAFAIRSTYHTTLEATPAQLVFGRDMLLPIQFQADWAAIRERRQKVINQSNERENKKRIAHEYRVGDTVSKNRPGIQAKMKRKRDGPFTITHVYDNGTVRIQRGAVSERLNVRRIQPYFERAPV